MTMLTVDDDPCSAISLATAVIQHGLLAAFGGPVYPVCYPACLSTGRERLRTVLSTRIVEV